MAFDITLSFNVETQELVNARNALQALTQTAKELNTSQQKAAAAAENLVNANEKLAETSKAAAKSGEDVAKSAEKTEKAAKSLGQETDAVTGKLTKLKDQASFLRDDLNLTEVGFTKSQAGVLAWAKSLGASSGTIKEFSAAFDNLNKITGLSPFDQSAKGLSALNSELRELKQVQTLAAESVGLTSKQVQMLSRDLEGVRQQNEAFGRSADEGVQKHRAAFIEAANAVNAYKEQVKIAQRESENLFKAEQELAKNRKLVNDELARSWGGSVGKKSQALSDLADQYAEEERMAAAHQAKLQKINSTAGNDAAAEYYRRQAAASKIASDAIEELERDTRKLIITNELLDRGFTSSSANAIFKYKEALEKTGISAIELKQKLYLLEQDLAKRQGTSPFAKMREDIQKVTQQTNHLARAISVQLGDVAISLAGGQNPFVVLLQQGDQIRGAVQQAVDAGQSIDKAMKGAVLSMVNSFKLVGTVVKEFAMDGLRSVGDSLNVVANQMARNNSINKQFADGTITATRHARLLEQASLQNAKALGTLRIVVGGVAAAIGVALAKAYFDASQENFELTKSLALTGASLGLSSERAISLAKSMTAVGVSATNGKTIITEMAKAGGFTAQQFTEISDSVVSFSEATGSSLKDVVKMFSEVNKDPVKALSDLQIAQGNVSQEIIKNVKELADQKNMVGASELAMREFARATKEVAEEIKVGMPWYKELGGWLDKAAQSAWDFAKGLWDSGSAAQQLEKIQKQLKEFKETGSTPWWVIGPIMKEDWANGIVKQQKEAQAKVEAQDKQAADRRAASQQEAGVRAAKSMEEGFEKTISSAEKKTISRQEFINKGIEEYKNALGNAAASVQGLAKAKKALGIEWDNAHKKSNRAAETYKAVRDNTIVETKKFYDTQLKALQDYESKQSQVNKSAYDSRAISLGEYLAKELQLVASSQNQQLSILKTSEAAYLSNVEARKQVLTASAKEAIAKGGNASKIMEKLDQDIENLENSTKSSTEAFKTQREALENATSAKYAKFYEEIAKTINASKDALEKFNETVSDNARKRSEALEEQRALLDLHGAEAAAYKASRSAMSGYSGEIRESKKALEEATKALSDFNETTAFDDTNSFEQYKILVENKTQAEKRFIETTSQAQKDSNQAAADAMLEYNLGVFKEIRDSLSESVYDALFEGGKNGGKAIKDTLKKMFKNYVINVFLNPIMGQVAGALGFGGGAAGSAGGVGNILGLANNLSSIYSAFSGGLVSSISGAIGTLGSTFGSSALTSFSAGMKGASLASGLAGPTTAGASGAMGAGASFANALPVIGWVMAGMGASANAYSQGYTEKGLNWANPIGLVEKSATRILKAVGVSDKLAHILTGASLTAKIFDKLGLGKSTPHTGAGAIYQGGSLQEGAGIFNRTTFGMGQSKDYAASSQSAVSGIAAQVGATLDAIAKTFGLQDNYRVSTAFADDRSKDGAWGALKISDALGNVLVNWENTRTSKWAPRIFSDGEKGFEQYLAAVQGDMLKAIQAMDLPSWAKQIFAVAEGAEGLKVALTQTALIVAQFESLGEVMSMFKGISGEVQSSLLAAFNGIEGLMEVADTFYQNFYSEQERYEESLKQMQGVLAGLDIDIDPAMGEKAKADYRAAVEGAMAAGNGELAAQLLTLGGSFASLADYAQEASDAVAEANDAAAEAARELAKNLRSSLIGLEARYANGGFSRLYQAQDAARDLQPLVDQVGWETTFDEIVQGMLSHSSAEVERISREMWEGLDSDEARMELVRLTGVMLDLAETSGEASDKFKSLSDKISSALAAMNSAGSLLDRIDAALGGSGNSYGLQREQRLWSALSSTTDYEKQIELAGELTNIVLDRHNLEQQNAQRLINFARDLRKYVDSLKIGNLSPLTTGEKLAEAARQYSATLEKARAGDDSAMSELQNISTNYLDLARQYYASSGDYTRIFNSVTTGLEALSISSQSEAQMQLSVSSQSLDQLVRLQGILEEAYGKASSEYIEQRDLLQSQIDYAEKTSTGIAVLAELLAGLPAEIGLFMSTGTSSGSYTGLAQKWVSLMQPYGLAKSTDQVARELQGMSAAELQHNYDIGANLLGNGAKRAEWDALFTSLREGMIDGSHRGGLDYVPFDGYIAQLHKGESVQTASENRSYGARSSNLNSSLVAEVKLLREEINLLRKENREDTDAVVTVTAKAGELNAKVVVEGINEARSKESYSNNLGAKLR